MSTVPREEMKKTRGFGVSFSLKKFSSKFLLATGISVLIGGVLNVVVSKPAGKVVTLLGPNGSGKSTVLKVASGQMPDGDLQALVRRRQLETMAGALAVKVQPQWIGVFAGTKCRSTRPDSSPSRARW